jgi:high-affinity iron transporter
MSRIFIFLTLIVYVNFMFLPGHVGAASEGIENIKHAKTLVAQSLDAANQDLAKSKDIFEQFHTQWLDQEATVKIDSKDAYHDIETQMGQVDYSFLMNKQDEVIVALQNLQEVLNQYINGQYGAGSSTDEDVSMTLSGFVKLLVEVKEEVVNHDQEKASDGISEVRANWLSVEGSVVAQSSSIYSDTERDLVIVHAMITEKNYDEAAQLLTNMVSYLSPLAQKSSYTMWDAAMIPIREGMEALLVVGSLLALVKKSNNVKGKIWIWSGVLTGLLISAILAVVIKFVFTLGAFGTNNFLIAGWTGLFAAVMLLYMSYWLHNKSNVKQWNQYIQDKTQAALSTGRIITLGALSFLAVFREGTETILFIIGMANQISNQQLLLGILTGFGILALIAVLMLYVGMKLPIRPFFLVSSLIIFYLCIKFTGLGIHSLQLAGLVPNSHSSILPSISSLAFFPSWQSTAPQVAIALSAIIFLIWSKVSKKERSEISI